MSPSTSHTRIDDATDWAGFWEQRLPQTEKETKDVGSGSKNRFLTLCFGLRHGWMECPVAALTDTASIRPLIELDTGTNVSHAVIQMVGNSASILSHIVNDIGPHDGPRQKLNGSAYADIFGGLLETASGALPFLVEPTSELMPFGPIRQMSEVDSLIAFCPSLYQLRCVSEKNADFLSIVIRPIITQEPGESGWWAGGFDSHYTLSRNTSDSRFSQAESELASCLKKLKVPLELPHELHEVPTIQDLLAKTHRVASRLNGRNVQKAVQDHLGPAFTVLLEQGREVCADYDE